VERIRRSGKHVVFDVDVVGGLNIKKMYDEDALAIFVMPPSIETLRDRLQGRGSDSKEDIQTRIDKAEFELTFASKFDEVVINDNLEVAKVEALNLVIDFIK